MLSSDVYTTPRSNWQLSEIEALLAAPFHELMYAAQTVHREHFPSAEVQVSTLLSIKTGGCPEDCKYCPQSAHYDTGLKANKLMQVEPVLEAAKAARDQGASRFCMGAAWRSPKSRDMDAVIAMIQGVKALGLETCMTLGMLTEDQADQLAQAGLDYYNHNIDTSPEFYDNIISTRTFEDRLQTLANVRDSGMKVCCGGILGMGETVKDRASMLQTLASLPQHPESVPINQLVKVEGTPLDTAETPNPFDFVRMVAVARLVLPTSYVRLSAGREAMSDEMQALCFLAGANSIFYGEKLLTTGNPEAEKDRALLESLGYRIEGEENLSISHAA